jgi:hypothetical protein
MSIADQVFKRTLLVAPQLSVSLILGTAFMEEHVKSLLSRERLMVLSSGVSAPLVRGRIEYSTVVIAALDAFTAFACAALPAKRNAIISDNSASFAAVLAAAAEFPANASENFQAREQRRQPLPFYFRCQIG